MKRCARCQEEKQESDFHKAKDKKDGLHSYCKRCNRAQARSWATSNKERKAKSSRAWEEANKEHIDAWRKKYRASNKDRLAKYDRQYQIKRKYSITLEEYNQILDEQNGVCAICKKEGAPYLHVDHAHDTGVIRGLLCRKCNSGLGFFNDDMDLLQKAAEYLTRRM